MKVHPLMLVLLIVVSVGASVFAIIHFAMIPLSSEYEKLQASYEAKEEALITMTYKYDHAKDMVHKKQDELSVVCLEAYIGAKVDNISPIAIKEMAESIIKYHREFGIPIELIVGIINVESMFNTTAFSSAKARGLMQVILEYHEELLEPFVKTAKELHDPDIGVKAGTAIIDHYLEVEDGNLSKALHRYNGLNGKEGVYSAKVYARACRYSVFRAKYFFDKDEALNTVNIMENEQAKVATTAVSSAGEKIE